MAKKHPEMRRFACGIVVKQLPPVATILKYFEVDFEDGLLLYKKRHGRESWDLVWNQNYVGKPVTNGGPGYVHIKIDGVSYAVHRLIWKLSTGADPRGVIDHINGIRDDNRLINLRDVMPSVNAMNHVNGRWAKEVARRAVLAKAERDARIENRERYMLARFKAKYEPAASPVQSPAAPLPGARP